MAGFLGAGVPVFEIRDAAGMTGLLVRTPALAGALARTLGASAAALMRGHGAVVVGPTIHHAVARSVYMEMNGRPTPRCRGATAAPGAVDADVPPPLSEGRGEPVATDAPRNDSESR
jgi:HCOMODA/2-hydroxy-3-carboxy-muconic semialdehyde decarboxylase